VDGKHEIFDVILKELYIMKIIAPLRLIDFQTNDDIDLGNGIKIQQLNDNVRQKLLDILPSDDKHKYLRTELDKTVLYNVLSATNEDTIEKIVNKTAEFLRLMRIAQFNVSSVKLIYHVNDCDEIIDYDERPIKIYNPQNETVREFNKETINIIMTIWSNYKKFICEKTRLWNAIFLHELAIQSFYLEFQILNDMIALECLFSNAMQEIAFQVSVRVASFLYPPSHQWHYSGKLDYFKKYKKIYKTRSKIVHGVLIEESEAKEASQQLYYDVQEILRKILQDDSLIAIFNNEEKLNEYLLSLTVGVNKDL